jgi:hypothetical protein
VRFLSKKALRNAECCAKHILLAPNLPFRQMMVWGRFDESVSAVF